VHSQLSADAACFIPSRQWHTATNAETSAASGHAVKQQHMNFMQSFNSNQQAKQWYFLLLFPA